MRRAAKVDTVQQSIVRDLQKLGWDVVKLKLPVDSGDSQAQLAWWPLHDGRM